jgi:hypothetical protein
MTELKKPDEGGPISAHGTNVRQENSKLQTVLPTLIRLIPTSVTFFWNVTSLNHPDFDIVRPLRRLRASLLLTFSPFFPVERPLSGMSFPGCSPLPFSSSVSFPPATAIAFT